MTTRHSRVRDTLIRQNLAVKSSLKMLSGQDIHHPARVEQMPFVNLDWKQRGNCVKSNVDFYPDGTAGVNRAKKVCQDCPVKKKCLDYALKSTHQFGVWGGMSERERKRLRNGRTGTTLEP